MKTFIRWLSWFVSVVKREIRLLRAPNLKKLIVYSGHDQSGIGKHYIYAPHPMTNWALNPGYENRSGMKLHTVEGFRKTDEADSVIKSFAVAAGKQKIYCFGGSTTYCTGLYELNSPWPSRLAISNDCVVANAGVGGWNTLQSLTRLISWAPLLKPNLIIVYQSKNDLTPLYNGEPSEEWAFPDYANLMGQFSSAVFKRGVFDSRRCWQANGGLTSVYGNKVTFPEKGLARCNRDYEAAIEMRYEGICNVGNILGAKVVFVPEIIQGGPYYAYMRKLHVIMKLVVAKHPHSFFVDLNGALPFNEKYFLDKMHFTELGCCLFSEVLSKSLKEKGLL
ncbi:MAG: SGNH/GDSL hydrolase family protein [Candidatus Margulisiibacteriota bacterium]